MWKALVLKELREIALVAALGLAALFYYLALAVGYQLPSWSHHNVADVPFVGDGFVGEAALISFLFAVALGLAQSYLESIRGTWLWLLHRPASRTQIVGVKLLVGAATYLLCAAVPLLCYAWWAATPGKHAGPFEWSMTFDAWRNWLWMLVIYLGSFLSGIYPGRWFGTRLLPLVGVAILATIDFMLGETMLPALRHWSWPGFVLLAAVCVYAILFVVRSRDFS